MVRHDITGTATQHAEASDNHGGNDIDDNSYQVVGTDMTLRSTHIFFQRRPHILIHAHTLARGTSDAGKIFKNVSSDA